MAFTRKSKAVNFNEPGKENVYNTTSASKDLSTTPITAPRPYFFVSELPDTSTVNTGASIFTERKMYALMEGNRRIKTWGASGAYGLSGYSNQTVHPIFPQLVQFDYPLEKDDFITQVAVGKGHMAAFVTAKGYLYTGGYVDDDRWTGFMDDINRYAFCRVAHAETITTATFSSGGAVGANNFVITAANANIVVGQQVVGFGVPSWTTVTAVSGTTITLSNVFNQTAAGVYSFGRPWGPGGICAKKVYLPSSTSNTNSEQWALVLSTDSNVYACGYNGHGQLGIGSAVTPRGYWDRVPGISNIKEVYCGSYTVYAITYSGQLWGWGLNNYGQLGIGDTTNRTSPTSLVASGVHKVFQKGADYETSFYISNDGLAYSCGTNYYGSLGINVVNTGNTTTWTVVNITNIGTRRVIDIKSTGTGSYNTTWFLCDDGAVFSCGYNGLGQVGDGTTTDRAIPTLITQPSGFPKVDRILVGGGSNTHFVMGVNMATGRMWSVGSFNHGAIGQAIGDPTGTWAFTSATTRAQYPARETLSIPSVEDGYTRIKDFFIMSSANGESTVYALCYDGTIWVRGFGHYNAKGHKFVQYYWNANLTYHGTQYVDTGWKQVEF
jgi:alpha-tubulin suppressor-like RCC1 family protein